MPDREKVLKGLEACRKTDCINCPYSALETEVCLVKYLLTDALALLKEQEEEIENLKQTAQSMMESVCLLKEQETIEGTIEETRGEWSDETLPVSCNETREYPVNNSGRNKA